MATIAIGDIHGSLRALEDLLGRIDGELGTSDTLVFLGDYIDRGPDSKGCIERILDLRRGSRFRVVTLLGNHEQWMLRTLEDAFRHSWVLMGAFATIESYSPQAAAILYDEIRKLGPRLVLDRVSLPYERFFDSVPEDHITFFKGLEIYHRTSDGVYVHGGLDPTSGPPEDQRTDDLVWGTDEFPAGYTGEDRIVYGHANDPVFDDHGWPHPRLVGRTYGLDTISEGVLTALRLPDGQVFQSARWPCEFRT